MRQRLVIAVLVEAGRVVSYATNEHEDCKRIGYPTGEGYELCPGCDYRNHAEYKAVQGQSDGILYLLGHEYACEPCKEVCAKRGIRIELPTN